MSPAEAGGGLAPRDLERAVELASGLEHLEPEAERRARLRSVLAAAREALPGGGAAVLAALPPAFTRAMGERGWLWNGLYALGADGRLHLGHASGPPVCAELERSGGPLSSGMCFDGLLLNQALAAYDVRDWPGYVSCDAHSGLATVAAIVVPVRDPAGRPLGVWDLDATEPVTAADVRFVEALLGCLARTVAFETAHLGARGAGAEGGA